jgi:hypothetical protein
MPQGPMLHFESSAFPIADDEDEETNPGIFGRSLAEWLAKQLEERGTRITGVIAEDFGWCVVVASGPHKLYVACSNSEDERTSWQVFAFAEGGLFRRLLGKDTSGEALNELHLKMRDILFSSSAIKALREEHDS